MLLKLTCPSCGRTEEVPDRVVGKELRCPCGTRFRVKGPNAPKPADQVENDAYGEPAGYRLAPPALPVQQSSLPAAQPVPRPPDNRPNRKPVPEQSGVSPWTHAAGGAGAVIVLGALFVLVRAFVSNVTALQVDARADQVATTTPKVTSPAPAAVASTSTPATVAPVASTPPPQVAQVEPTPAEPVHGEGDLPDREHDDDARALAAPSSSIAKGEIPTPTPTVTPTPPSATSSTSSAPLTTAQIVARCEPSVALVKGKVSSGTGFLVRPNLVATNAHVINDEFVSNLEVRFPGAPAGLQGPVHVQLMYEDPKRDLAFLAISTKLPALEIAPEYGFIKGEDITVIGSPGFGDDQVLENAVSRGVMSSKTQIDGQNYLQMNISINPGNSGGPVFDSAGRVIGVATLKATKAEATAFCIPVEDLQKAIAQVGPPRPELANRRRRELAFRILVTAGAFYGLGLETRGGAGVRVSVPASKGQSDQPPSFRELVSTLDNKLFSQVDPELSHLKRDPDLKANTRKSYADLAVNYRTMKDLYENPGSASSNYFTQVQELKDRHLRLAESLRNELKLEVPPQLLALLQRRATQTQQPAMVADAMPFQPRLFVRPGMRQAGPGRQPGARPQGPNAGPPAAPPNKTNDARRRMLEARDRVRDLQSRAQGGGP
jgi:S1-C subfamily serine protease